MDSLYLKPYVNPEVSVPSNRSQTIVSTNPVAASLSPQNFDSPLEFRPERWLEGDTKDNLEAAQPFSLGPRGCLGRKYEYSSCAYG